MSIILKDWYGKDQRFDHDKIFVRDEYGKLVQFTQGTGNPEVNEVILNNLEVTGFAEDSTYGAYSKTLTFGTDIEDFEIIVGKEYTVSWDGVMYQAVAKDTGVVYEDVGEDGETVYYFIYYLGNGSLLDFEGLEGNNEPFAIQYTTTRGYTSFKSLTIVTTDTAESHVLGLIKRVRPRETLDMMLESITVTENGTYTANEIYDGLKTVNVEVPEPVLQDKEVTENGEYSADEGYDGLGKVTVDIPTPEVNLQDKTITENGTFTADEGYDGLGKVLVDIISSGSAKVVIGKKYNSNNTAFTITHGLGVVPDIILVFLAYLGNNYGSGTLAYIGVSKAFREKFGTDVCYQTGIELNSGTLNLRSSNSKDFTVGSLYNQYYIQSADENTFTIPPGHLSNCHYSWIAIGGLTE